MTSMLIKNANVFVGKEFVKADIEFDKTITALGDIEGKADIDAEGLYVVPGLIDIHTHGALGYDFSDGDETALKPLAKYYAENGVTSFLATTMTLNEEALTKAVNAVHDHTYSGGAKCQGIHLEGPFLSREKRGAQNEEYLCLPDVKMFERLNAQSGEMIKIVTLACELDGAVEFIKEVSSKCVVSLGHTTADYNTAMQAYKAGASHATHLYNAMPPLLHREPGVIGAAVDFGASAEMICDGLHIHESVIRASFKMFGDKLCFISDSLRCAGMPDGDYELGRQQIELKNGKATVKGTNTLAGSTITVLDALKNAVKFGIALEDAVYAATCAPATAARLIGIGKIEIGYCADLLVLDKRLNPVAVFVDGVKV